MKILLTSRSRDVGPDVHSLWQRADSRPHGEGRHLGFLILFGLALLGRRLHFGLFSALVVAITLVFFLVFVTSLHGSRFALLGRCLACWRRLLLGRGGLLCCACGLLDWGFFFGFHSRGNVSLA